MKQIITNNLATWTTAPKGIKKLRELILELAVRGLLVPQDVNDEPASELLTKIAAEKARLVSEGKIKPPKPLAKISEEEKPFDLPMGWEWVRLGDIALALAGFAFKANNFNQSQDGLPLIRIRDVGQVFSGTYYSGEYREEFLVDYGDYLISMDGQFRIAKWKNGKALLNQRVTRLIFFFETIGKRFVAESLQARLLELQGTKAYTTVDHLSTTQITESLISLPPLAEQQRIVAKVDELMQLCDRLEEKQNGSEAMHRQLVSCLLTTLTEAPDAQAFQAAWSRIAANFDNLFTTEHSIEQLKQTILQLAVMGKLVPQNPSDEPASELLKKIATEKARLITEGKIKKQNPLPKISEQEKPFALPNGWEWERLGTVFNGGSGTTPLRSQIQYFINGTENWFKTTDLNLSIVLNGEEKITKQAVEECNLTYYPKDTVCIAMYGGGGTIGKSGMLGVSATINQSVFALPPIEQFNSYFLHLYIKSIRSMWMGFAAGLRKDPNINGLIIKKMLLPIPPLPEQHRIVTKVDELLTLCEQLKTKLATAQTLQQQLADTLVQQAVA